MAEPVTPRRRGRPKQPKGISIETIDDDAPEVQDWGDMTRLEVLQAVLNALQLQWADKGMPARDRTPASRAIASAAEQVQSEKQRLYDLNPDPILAVDQAELLTEILAGLALLPRVMVDAVYHALGKLRMEM